MRDVVSLYLERACSKTVPFPVDPGHEFTRRAKFRKCILHGTIQLDPTNAP